MLASATFAVLWFLCGLIAVLTMLFQLGGKPEASSRSMLKWNHRIFGGIFSIGYLIFAVLMIPKFQGNAPFLPPVIVAHSYLAAALFPILLFKHFIVRIAKRFYPSLPYVGTSILVIAFLVVAATGINHIILWTKVPKVTVESADGPRIVSTAVGRDLLAIKCARCHPLRDLYKTQRSQGDWRKTINRMHRYDEALIITQGQADHLVGYLSLAP